MSESRKLPPSERDFDIYEAVHIAGYPTREQAEKHDISQTRVRQIVRRVIEWLGEIIPPQAKVAKEQQSHLARQIAADRFNLQYAEASTNWYQSGDLKFAGLRIRITHAQARLGVPGSLIGGLAADAIEGLEVPAYLPPPEPVGRAMPATQTRSVSEDDPVYSQTGPTTASDEFPEIPNLKIPDTYPADPVPYREITEEAIVAREAAGCPFPFKLIKYLYDHGYLPRPNAEHATATSSFTTPDSLLPTPSANPQSEIHTPQSPASTPRSEFRAPRSSPPPPGDCSAEECAQPVPADETHHAPAQTPSAVSPCDDNAAKPNAAVSTQTAAPQPLLTAPDQLPVINLTLSSNQPATVMIEHAGSSQRSLPTPAHSDTADVCQQLTVSGNNDNTSPTNRD